MKIENVKEGQVFKNYKELCKFTNEKTKNGNSKVLQMKEFKRFFEYHRNGQKIIIDKIYEEPLPAGEGRRWNHFKNFDNLHISKELYNKNGVDKIIQNNKIYVGSTTAGFRHRFMQHRVKNNITPMNYMLNNGGYFDIIWIAPEESTEPEIRAKENIYIDYYKNNKDWICINENYAWSLIYKEKIKYKKLNISEKDYDKVLKLLLDNNINFKK